MITETEFLDRVRERFDGTWSRQLSISHDETAYRKRGKIVPEKEVVVKLVLGDTRPSITVYHYIPEDEFNTNDADEIETIIEVCGDMMASEILDKMSEHKDDINGMALECAMKNIPVIYKRIISRHNRLRHLLEMGAPQIIISNERFMLRELMDKLARSVIAENSEKC